MARAALEPSATPRDARILQLFGESIESLGGLKGLTEMRRLDWLTELMESAYVLVLRDQEQKSDDDIADASGLSTGAVNAILDASSEGALVRLLEEPPADRLDREYTAGGITKFVYKNMRQAEGGRV